MEKNFKYELLISAGASIGISTEGVLTLLRYYTYVHDYGMQESLDYVGALFANGTIQQVQRVVSKEIFKKMQNIVRKAEERGETVTITSQDIAHIAERYYQVDLNEV